MRDNGAKITNTQRKLDTCTNNLTKLVLSDLAELILEEYDKTWFNLSKGSQKILIDGYIERLPDIYHGQLTELRSVEKKKSKQLEINDGLITHEGNYCGL